MTTVQLAKGVFQNGTAPPQEGEDGSGLDVFGVVSGYVLILVQFLQTGIVYVLQRKKLQGSDSAEAEPGVCKAMERTTLVVKNARDKCLAAVRAGQDYLNRKVHPSEDALFAVIRDASPEVLQELLDIDLAQQFPLAKDDVYEDAVSKLFVAHSRAIAGAASQVTPLFQGFEEGGLHSWKKDLPTTTPEVNTVTFAELLQAAHDSVEKVDGKRLRQSTEAYYEVPSCQIQILW